MSKFRYRDIIFYLSKEMKPIKMKLSLLFKIDSHNQFLHLKLFYK